MDSATCSKWKARGRFWIEPTSGRVVRTELGIRTQDAGGTVTVSYAPQPAAANLWLPVSMNEEYTNRSETIEGRATYTNFRTFSVDVSTIIKK